MFVVKTSFGTEERDDLLFYKKFNTEKEAEEFFRKLYSYAMTLYNKKEEVKNDG